MKTKKTVIGTLTLAAVVLLAVVLGTTCTLFDDPDTGVVKPRLEVDENGREWIWVDIETGGSAGDARNAALEFAKVSVTYNEVVFYDAGEYYRVAGPRGRTLTIRLPVGLQLHGADHAIVFSGSRDPATEDKNLLATGIVTHTNFGKSGEQTFQTTAIADTGQTTDAGVSTVRSDTVNIRFLLYAVETWFPLVHATAAHTPASGAADEGPSSFTITGVTAGSGTLVPAGSMYESLTATTGAMNNPLGIYTEDTEPARTYPFWKLPKNTGPGETPAIEGVTATATFNPGVREAHRLGVRVDLLDEFEFDSWAVQTGYADDGLTAVIAKPRLQIGAVTTLPTDGAFHGAANAANDGIVDAPIPSGAFTIDIEMRTYPVNQGFCTLLMNLPVMAISTLNPKGDVWTLRNGYYDDALHGGNYNVAVTDETMHSLGASLLLCIGDPPSAARGKAIQIILSKWGTP